MRRVGWSVRGTGIVLRLVEVDGVWVSLGKSG